MAKCLLRRRGMGGLVSAMGFLFLVRREWCARFPVRAWIASIHRGVDVARALKHGHVIASTGATSEATAQGFA